MEPKLIIKGDRYYSKSKRSSTAINQFKDLVKRLPDVMLKQETTQQTTRINTWNTDVHGLTSIENRELGGILNPKNSIDPKSRIGDNSSLQIQADHFQEAIDKTIGQ